MKLLSLLLGNGNQRIKKRKMSSSNYLKKINKYHIILLIIIFLGIFLRFYNTPLRYSLGDDSSRDALIALSGSTQLQLPLIGPFSSLGPFTFGPWYYIQLIIFTMVTRFMYAPWIFMGICSVLCIFIMYKIGEILENKILGLLLAFLVAISPVQILTAVTLSNPWIVSLYATLSIWIFLKISKEPISNWWSLLLGIILGIGINSHYSMAALLVLPLIYFFYKPKQYISFFFICLGIFISFIPLLFFDLQNNWYNLRNISYTYMHMKERIYVANSWTIYIRNFWPYYWSETIGVPMVIGTGIMIASVVAVGIAFAKKRLSILLILLLIAFFIDFIQLRYYGGERFISYLQYLQPFVFIFTGYLLFQISKIRYGLYGICFLLGILCFFVMPENLNKFTATALEVNVYETTNFIREKYPSKKIALYNCKEYNYTKMQAILYILSAENRIDKSGKKLAFSDSHCKVPYKNTVINSTSSALLSTVYPIYTKMNLIDLSLLSEQQLVEYGWTYRSSKKVYNKTVKWWIKEEE